MLLSLEAIVLAILILNSDTRQGEKDRAMVRKDLKVDRDSNDKLDAVLEILRDKL
jgi:uncharacterized membrane protein